MEGRQVLPANSERSQLKATNRNALHAAVEGSDTNAERSPSMSPMEPDSKCQQER